MDLIERQVAIDAITSYNGVVDKSVAKRILIQLPPSQPETYWNWGYDTDEEECKEGYCHKFERRTDECTNQGHEDAK